MKLSRLLRKTHHSERYLSIWIKLWYIGQIFIVVNVQIFNKNEAISSRCLWDIITKNAPICKLNTFAKYVSLIWANPGLFCVYFCPLLIPIPITVSTIKIEKNQRWCVWDSKPGPWDGRRIRNHGTMAAALCEVCFPCDMLGCVVSGQQMFVINLLLLITMQTLQCARCKNL